jgi:hypothetical protein
MAHIQVKPQQVFRRCTAWQGELEQELGHAIFYVKGGRPKVEDGTRDRLRQVLELRDGSRASSATYPYEHELKAHHALRERRPALSDESHACSRPATLSAFTFFISQVS